MIDQIFQQMSAAFQPEALDRSLSYYFSIDETKKTLFLEPQGCRVEEGKTTDEADCVCKTSAEFFAQIWHQGYRPGLKDFLSGAIRTNNPEALKTLLAACGKEG